MDDYETVRRLCRRLRGLGGRGHGFRSSRGRFHEAALLRATTPTLRSASRRTSTGTRTSLARRPCRVRENALSADGGLRGHRPQRGLLRSSSTAAPASPSTRGRGGGSAASQAGVPYVKDVNNGIPARRTSCTSAIRQMVHGYLSPSRRRTGCSSTAHGLARALVLRGHPSHSTWESHTRPLCVRDAVKPVASVVARWCRWAQRAGCGAVPVGTACGLRAVLVGPACGLRVVDRWGFQPYPWRLFGLRSGDRIVVKGMVLTRKSRPPRAPPPDRNPATTRRGLPLPASSASSARCA